VIALKIDRALFALLMGFTTAVSVYVAALVDFFYPGPLGTATVVFVGAVASIIIVYLATEQQTLPPQPVPA